MARGIDVNDKNNAAQGNAVIGAASLPTHSKTQGDGHSVAANTSGSGVAQKTGVVAGTGMNPDVNAGVAIEAV